MKWACHGSEGVFDGALNNLPLSSSQHGFVKNQSMLNNLIITENDIADALNEHEPVDIIIFDFSSAFDKVPQQLLLYEIAIKTRH